MFNFTGELQGPIIPFHVVEPTEQTLMCLSNFSKEHLTEQSPFKMGWGGGREKENHCESAPIQEAHLLVSVLLGAFLHAEL